MGATGEEECVQTVVCWCRRVQLRTDTGAGMYVCAGPGVCLCVHVCVKAVGVHRCVHVCRSNVWERVDMCTEEPLLSAPAVLAGVLPVGSVVLPSIKLK